jgi:osmotically-inducible protein OsmY
LVGSAQYFSSLSFNGERVLPITPVNASRRDEASARDGKGRSFSGANAARLKQSRNDGCAARSWRTACYPPPAHAVYYQEAQMADRDYFNDRGRSGEYDDRERSSGWDRNRDADRNWSDRNRDRDDRGPISRGTDEVRSWFGDDEARRRREMDEQRERQRDMDRNRSEERGWAGSTVRGRAGTYGEPSSSGGSSRDRGDASSSWNRDTGASSGGWSNENRESGGMSRSDFGGSPSGFGGSSSNYGYGGSSGGYGGSSGGYGGSPSGYGRENWSGTTERSSGYGDTSRSGGSFAGRGPRSYQRSDERIREEVNERLTADARVDASDIDVEVKNGEVTLRGRVDERRDKRAAEEAIEDIPGVKDVKNDLRVERSGGWSSGGSDRERGDRDRSRENEGGLGHTGNPQQREDVTTLNLSGTASQAAGNTSNTTAGTTVNKDKDKK